MKNANAERLLEPEIKSIVLTHLIKKGILTPKDTVFNEFTVDNSSRRVDLAIAKGDELWAFEIKSEADTLFRLKGQIDTYSKYFDKVFVIVASKHKNTALELISKSTALWEIKKRKLIVRQKGRKKLIKNQHCLIDMMDIPDLIKVVNQNGLKSTSNRRVDLVKTLEKVSIKILREAAIRATVQKCRLSSKIFFEEVIDRKVTSDDISLLSRFKIQKKKNTIEPDEIEKIINKINKISPNYYSILNVNAHG